MKNKPLVIVLSVLMMFTLLPCAGFAAENGEKDPTEPTQALVPEKGDTDLPESTEFSEDGALNVLDETESTEPTEPTESTEPIKEPWKSPSGSKLTSLSLCCNSSGAMFNLMANAGQKLYGYDTLQGACANAGYGYFTLYNRKNNKCKLVKVRLEDMAVVKVSAAMAIKHANEITFNNKKNIIVVANSTPKPKRLTVINPNSLSIMYHKTLSVKKGVSGLTKKQKKKFKGVGAITYNEKYNCYICYMRTNHNLLYLDGNLKPYKAVKQNARTSLLFQGMDSYEDCIMVCQSFKGKKKYNTITVYNMNGRYIAKFTSPKGNGQELETIFHDGDQFYAGFYRFYGAKKDNQKKKVKRINYVYKINNL